MANPAKPLVFFYFHKVSFALRNRKKLKNLIAELFEKEGKSLGRLNYVFCTDQEILQINSKYLGHNYYTDVITFDLSKSERIEGEIYVSIDRVRDNAAVYKAPLSQELHRVLLHGALHLCGYRDKSRSEKASMKKREDYYLKKYANVSRETTSAGMG
jgi:rRNA maturation RNase YbeY